MKNTLQFAPNFSRSIRMLGLALAALSLAVCAQAQTLTYLGQFNGANGGDPYGPVVQAPDGNFYGQARGPGSAYGEIFRATPTGQITTLYSFCSQPNCADGNSSTPPILGSDGNLYGVALHGSGGGYTYSGTLYRMTLVCEITTLYTFCPSANCTYEEIPDGIIQASDGNFYGTTYVGGANESGTIFEVSSAGVFTLLHTFCSLANCADGYGPLLPPIQGSDGNFYGTVQSYAGGVVYKLTPSGAYTVIHTFCLPCAGGGNPVFSKLSQDAEGNLFGTTIYAADYYNSGTVFEITPTNKYTGLYSFVFGGGVAPGTGLTLANDGNLYGVAVNDDFDTGGGYGIAYEVTPAGEFTSLASFYNDPNGPLVQGTDGNFYATTQYNTAYLDSGDGTVFKLSAGLSPLVKTNPTMGKVGRSVIILGNNLTGTTSVTFNGVAAAFTVESDTYIKATVPTGATTGLVSVVTPTGTLNSNPQFVVTK